MHKLMIKTHNKTGLKYLCYTQKDDHVSYTGSGVLWKIHLDEHDCDFSTELIFETEDYTKFKQTAIQKSIEFDVVDSDEWANLKIEEGDGGDTVSRKRWITDGNIDKYMNVDSILPDGWKFGRSNCVFNDPEKQSDFSKRADYIMRGKSIKKAWDDGKMNHRDNSKCGVSGDDNPSKKPENRKKISDSMKLRSAELSIRMKKHKPWEKSSRGHGKSKNSEI